MPQVRAEGELGSARREVRGELVGGPRGVGTHQHRHITGGVPTQRDREIQHDLPRVMDREGEPPRPQPGRQLPRKPAAPGGLHQQCPTRVRHQRLAADDH